MLWIFKLIVSANFLSFTFTSNIRINQTKVPWTVAVVRCNIMGSRIASQTDIDQDKQICEKEIFQNTSFWIGNYVRLSNTIEVEGCFIGSFPDSGEFSRNGHHSLFDCYQLCTTSFKSLIFAHHNFIGTANCICNLTGVNILGLGESKQSSQCVILKKWWKYKIHKNEFQTGIESCQQISCSNGDSTKKIFKDRLCGPRDNDKTPDVDLLHICTTNSNNNTTTDIGLPWKFSFIYNASIETDSEQIESMVAECKANACVNGNTFENLTRNCTSETLGFVCLSESSTSKEKITYASSESKLVHDASTSAYTKSPEEITKFATIPGAPDIKSLMTYISSDSHSHVTRSSKENIVHSTSHEVLNQNVNDDSPIGLLVGLLVTALVIVVIVVLLVVCRFKRKGPFRIKRFGDDRQITKFHSPNFHEKDNTSNKKAHTVQNSTYDMHTASENENEFSLSDPDSNHLNYTSNSEYAVVIKNRQMIGNTTKQQQIHDEENLEVIENEYDGLNHNRTGSFNSRKNSNNIYDTSSGFREQSDSTYGTAKHVHVVDKDENSVYDHM